MSPANYMFGVVVGAALAFSAAVGSFLVALGKPLEVGRWANECLTIKRTATERVNPRIIILGGSNGLFGFSAQRLSEVHGVPAVNASVHAGLGIEYILHYGRQQIMAGRVFVLPLEYSLYGKRNLANDAALYQMAGYDPGFFWGLSLADKVDVLREITPLNRVGLIMNLLRPSPRSAGRYESATLNAFGDETANTVANRKAISVENVKGAVPELFVHDDGAWNALARFSADAKAGGATVVLAHPNIYSGALDSKRNEAFFREIHARAGTIGLKVIGTPIGSAFNDEDVFDMIYHQNTQGQARSTDRLLSELRRAEIM